LDGQVDADAAQRRHRVYGISDAQQTVGMPAPQPSTRTSRCLISSMDASVAAAGRFQQ
jgi:hypothetical protein